MIWCERLFKIIFVVIEIGGWWEKQNRICRELVFFKKMTCTLSWVCFVFLFHFNIQLWLCEIWCVWRRIQKMLHNFVFACKISRISSVLPYCERTKRASRNGLWCLSYIGVQPQITECSSSKFIENVGFSCIEWNANPSIVAQVFDASFFYHMQSNNFEHSWHQ